MSPFRSRRQHGLFRGRVRAHEFYSPCINCMYFAGRPSRVGGESRVKPSRRQRSGGELAEWEPGSAIFRSARRPVRVGGSRDRSGLADYDHPSSSQSRQEPRPILMSQDRRLRPWRRSMPDSRGAVDRYMMVGEVRTLRACDKKCTWRWRSRDRKERGGAPFSRSTREDTAVPSRGEIASWQLRHFVS